MTYDHTDDFKVGLSRDPRTRRQSMRIYMDKDLYVWVRTQAKGRIMQMGEVINGLLREIYNESKNRS